MDDKHFETREIQTVLGDDEHGSVVAPITASVTYRYDSPTETKGSHRYSRMSNPTRDTLESALCSLEGGEYCACFASGMAAINTVFTTALSAGSHVVAGEDLYAESRTLLTEVFSTFDVDITFVDTTNVNAVSDAIRPATDLVYLESPTNPLVRISDIEAIGAVIDDHDCLFAVDNTFASPYLQQPLELGADVVIESLTKYISGHSDVIAGALTTNDEELYEQLTHVQYNQGGILSPYETFLVQRGVKTLARRMDAHCENAAEIVAFLQDHPAVNTVYYPGLESHPNHDVAKKQMEDYGGMVSFELDADLETTADVVTGTEVFTLAESLGAVESLIECPALMTHQDVPPEDRRAAGITDGLIRLSVGIENGTDLVADLENAIDAALE